MGTPGTEYPDAIAATLYWKHVYLPIVEAHTKWQEQLRATCRHVKVIKPLPWKDEYECFDCGLPMELKPKD